MLFRALTHLLELQHILNQLGHKPTALTRVVCSNYFFFSTFLKPLFQLFLPAALCISTCEETESMTSTLIILCLRLLCLTADFGFVLHKVSQCFSMGGLQQGENEGL